MIDNLNLYNIFKQDIKIPTAIKLLYVLKYNVLKKYDLLRDRILYKLIFKPRVLLPAFIYKQKKKPTGFAPFASHRWKRLIKFGR